jgi:gluconolactonase
MGSERGTALADPDCLEVLYSGATWGEGPVWLPAAAVVRWSDIPGDRILQFDPATGTTTVHRDRVEYTNGRTLDREGRVIQCSHGRRSVEMEVDGEPITLVDRWNGYRFNSPNDVVVASDGGIWFSDPAYGIEQPTEGHPGEREYGGCFVFHLDPRSGEVTPVITSLEAPNGLAFSRDETTLYVSDSGFSDPKIWEFDVDVAGRTASNQRPFTTLVGGGLPDGFRIDVAGRVWTSAEHSVQVFSPRGELLLTIPVPELVSNVCFGGGDGRDLYITATTSLYRIATTTTAAQRPSVVPDGTRRGLRAMPE